MASVFLCHASEDKCVVELIQLALASSGYKVFYDKQSLPPGGDYQARIRAAIERCDIFVFVASPSALNAGKFTLTELAFARKRWETPVKRVLPVILHGLVPRELPAYLQAATVLTVEGSPAAEVRAAVEAMVRELGATRRRLTTLFASASAIAAVSLIAIQALGNGERSVVLPASAAQSWVVNVPDQASKAASTSSSEFRRMQTERASEVSSSDKVRPEAPTTIQVTTPVTPPAVALTPPPVATAVTPDSPMVAKAHKLPTAAFTRSCGSVGLDIADIQRELLRLAPTEDGRLVHVTIAGGASNSFESGNAATAMVSARVSVCLAASQSDCPPAIANCSQVCKFAEHNSFFDNVRSASARLADSVSLTAKQVRASGIPTEFSVCER